jgi:hypothetical protein
MSRLMEWTRSDRPREVEDNAQDHTEHLKNVLNHYIKTPQRIKRAWRGNSQRKARQLSATRGRLRYVETLPGALSIRCLWRLISRNPV